MNVADLISILQQHDPAAVIVLSMCQGEDVGDLGLVAAEPADICAVQLRAVDDGEEYRARYVVVLGDGAPGVCLA